MSQELHFTSAPKGLKATSKPGFVTVAATEGMSQPLIDRLESLSGYRAVFRLGDPRWGENPVIHAHWRLTLGGRTHSVLSRVSAAPPDYTGRSNNYAHHLVLDPNELPSAGPAWVMLQSGVMQAEWNGSPRIVPARAIPSGQSSPHICERWQALTGDAGHAGMLVDAFLLDASKAAYVIFNTGTDPLPLIDEAIALLPPNARWNVTFSTYFTELPVGLTCAWRFCCAGTPAAKDASRHATSGVIIDLTASTQETPKETRFVHLARTGQPLAHEAAAAVGAREVDQNDSVRLALVGGSTLDNAGENSGVRQLTRKKKTLQPATTSVYQSSEVDASHIGSASPDDLFSPAGQGRAAYSTWLLTAASIVLPVVTAVFFWFSMILPDRGEIAKLKTELKDERDKAIQQHAPATTQPSDASQKLDNDLKLAKQRLSEVEKERDEQKRKLDEQTALASSVQRQANELELKNRELKELKELVDQLRKTSAEASGSAQAGSNTPAVAPGERRENSPLSPKASVLIPVSVELPNPKPVRIGGEFKSEPTPIGLTGITNGSRLTFRFPQKQEQYKVTESGDGVAIEFSKAGALATKTLVSLATITVVDGALQWTWGDYQGHLKDPEVIRAFQKQLEYGSIFVSGGAGEKGIQFKNVVTIDWRIGPQEAPLELTWPEHFSMQLCGGAIAQPWRLENNERGIWVKGTASAFTIETDSKGRMVSSWKQMRKLAEDGESKMKADAQTLEQDSKNAKGEVDWQSHQDNKKKFDDKKADEERYRKQREELDSLPEFSIYVRIPQSGVVLYQVNAKRG